MFGAKCLIKGAAIALGLFVSAACPTLLAQDTADSSQPNQTSEQQAEFLTAKLERLEFIQGVLSQKIAQRSGLGEDIEAANEQDKEDLRAQADALTVDIEKLRSTLQNLAIGGLDTSLFVSEEVEKKSDWQEDIALIAEPVIESLKELTEKPRRLSELNDAILRYEEEVAIADKALSSLKPTLALTPSDDLSNTLDRFTSLWEGRKSDAQSAITIANIQIAELEGDQSFTESLLSSLQNFVTGRGLTLVLALLAAIAVWHGVRFILRSYRAYLSGNAAPERRTRYRLAAYTVHALTFSLSILAVFVVFYERGDVLLLGLLVLLIVGLALGIRHLLPRYVSEARLLLNVGAMREQERVLYRGLPWNVESINMYTILRNPELNGDLRIPLAEFHGITSRIVGDERWFPTSKGDVVLLSGTKILQVLDQNPDTVELQERGGQIVSIPTATFYGQEMINLSRSGSFGVTSTFGVDYDHQDISLVELPALLTKTIQETLENSPLAEHIVGVDVELNSANDSSLDYWILVTCNSAAALFYFDLQRLIQQACVSACSKESISIPFPHISLVQKKSAA